MSEFKYEITEEIAVISTSEKGWSKELNLVSWNEREAKYDIRDWAPDRGKMSRGITLTADEVMKLRDILKDLQLPPN